MKTLIGIPVIYCPQCIQKTIDCIKNQDCEILIIDNSTDQKIKDIIKPYNTITNPKNNYVNPSWNQIIKHFLNTDNDLLIIQNSDLYLKHNAIQKIKELKIDEDKIIPCLNLVQEYNENPRKIQVVLGGVAGVFIPLTKKMAQIVYPIPESIKIWFGDNWIYSKLQKEGYKLTIYSDIQATHQWSSSVSTLPEAHMLIEQDKKEWITIQQQI